MASRMERFTKSIDQGFVLACTAVLWRIAQADTGVTLRVGVLTSQVGRSQYPKDLRVATAI